MKLRAFRLGNLTAHNYGCGEIVLIQSKGDPFNCHMIRVDAKKLKRKLKKFLKEK